LKGRKKNPSRIQREDKEGRGSSPAKGGGARRLVRSVRSQPRQERGGASPCPDANSRARKKPSEMRYQSGDKLEAKKAAGEEEEEEDGDEERG
jgi:hypothetical protein